MACCTTIPPLNSTGQKRSSGGIFDLPKSAKRRRPFGSTSVTTINSPHIASALTNSPPSSKFLTSSMFSNINLNNGNGSNHHHHGTTTIIDANDENNKKKSVFQASRSCFTSNTSNLESYSSPFAHQHQQQQQHQQNFNDHQQFEFKNELMERIKHEAKRLIKRKQAPNLSTVNTGSTSNNSTDEEETLVSSSSPSSTITTSTSSLLSASSAASITKTASSSSLSPQTINDGLQANKLLTSSNLILIPSNTSIITKTLSTSNLPQTPTATLSPLTTSLKRANEITNNNSRLNLASVGTKLNHNDLPLFSMNQVNQICSGMIREREQFIREQYDKILAEKLSEQYDSFVKFTHEQIQRRFEKSQCSYVS